MKVIPRVGFPDNLTQRIEMATDSKVMAPLYVHLLAASDGVKHP